MMLPSLLLTLFSAGGADPVSGQDVPPVSREEFEQLLGKLVPDGLEKWQTIPWESDLLDARDKAAREHKPLLIWSMNGNPLGCT
jgi:hypothetical protein